MKLSRYFRNPYKTAVPTITTWSWWSGAASGIIISSCIYGILDGKTSARYLLAFWVLIEVMNLSFEISSRKYRKVQMAMLNEAHYMNGLFDKGIDVGSENFTIAQIDADYR